MSGALRLCGEAALRSGAGKVTLLTHPDHAAVLNVGRAELMVRGVAGGGEAAEALADADVLVLGTGLGRSDWSKSLLEACRGIAKPMVLDADALNWLAEAGDVDDFIKTGSAVLTPHPAEAGRLLGLSAAEVQQDRVSAAQALADKSGAVVVLKGCGTVVSEQGGRYAICPLGNPGMASAGTGDVLSGVIGAMLAQGLDAWAAATVGVVAHAAAGDRAACEIGERGLIASDLIERLPAVLNPR
jgi:NAD(P)H-hydrate epimerase